MMKVSIRQALKNVASKRYDKQNIFLFFVISFISTIITLFLPEELLFQNKLKSLPPEEIVSIVTSGKVLFIFILQFILSIFITGIGTTAYYNAIRRKKGVFPNPIDNVGNIFLQGLKYIFGFLLVYLIIQVSSLILAFILASIHAVLILLVIPFVVCFVHAFICANLLFFTSLKFKDWFAFKSAWKLVSSIMRRYASYIAKSILLFLILCLIYFLIVMSLSLIGGVVSVIIGDMEKFEYIFTSLYMCVFTPLSVLFVVYNVDLTAQLLGPCCINKKKIVKPKQDSQKQQEHLG